MAVSHTDFRKQIVDASNSLVNTGVLSFSGHGNASVRIPGTETMLLTGVSSLLNTRSETLAVVDFDGNTVEGEVASTSREIIQMHACVYKVRDDVQSVIHTHSTYATAFALAHEPLPCRYEALLRMGLDQDVPVAPWGPRGSDESVRFIVEAVNASPGTMAVLLANHGVLAFGSDAPAAARAIIAMEEAAAMTLAASPIGGAKPFPAGALRQVRERLKAFGG
ncbi:MAG: class II aldolase/adducin family protein [Chloroflexota bacterium]